MALIVEDGTGMATAEAYVSLADANTRHTAMGNAAWTGADSVKEAAIRRATAYMEQAYRNRWKGTRLFREQALSWPRYGAEADGWVIPSTEVPADVANACADLALRALADDLNADQSRAVKREKVGPLETEYADYAPLGVQFRAVDMALSAYLKGGAAMAQLIRA